MINRLLLLMLTLASFSSAGQCVVSGHILDAKTMVPLPYATVIDLDTEAQTAADDKGFFQLEGSCSSHTIQVHFIGYQSLVDSVAFSTDAHYDLVLVQSTVAINEVTISGAVRNSILPFVPMEKLLATSFSSGLNQHAAALFSAVEGVSSINTGTNSGQPSIRGLFGSRVGIIVDGIPQQNQQWGIDHGLDIDPWLIQQYAVHKTGAGLLFGPSASSGAIEVETTPNLERNETKWSLIGRGLSATQMGEGALTFAKRWKHLQVFAVGSARTYADYQVPANDFTYLDRTFELQNGRLVNTSGTSNGQQIAALWEKETRTVQINLRRSHQAFGIFPGIFGIPSTDDLLGDGDSRETALPRMTSTHSIASMRLEELFAHSKLEINAAVQLSERAERGEAHAHNNAPLPASNLALGLSLRTLFFDVNWTEFDLKKYRVYLKAQAELQNSSSEGWEFLISDYRGANFGLMAGVKMDLGEGHLNLGVRADLNELEVLPFEEQIYNGDGVAAGSAMRSPEIHKQFLAWGANANYTAKIGQTTDVQAILARSVRSPNAYESAANGVHHGTFRHEKGNAELTPEVGYVFDVQVSKRKNWLVNPFFGYYANFIYLAPSAQFSTLPEAGQLYQFMQSEVMRYGAEIVFEKTFRKWDIEVGGAYVNGLVLDEGTALPWTPPFNASTEIKRSWSFKNNEHSLFMAPRLEAFAKQNQVFRNEDPTPGYQLLNFSIGYVISKGANSIEMIAFATNLMNRTYIDHMSRYKILNLPEVGRNVGITINYKF